MRAPTRFFAPIRFFFLISKQEGGVIGVHADASDHGSAATAWAFIHDEIELCHEFLDDGTLPEPGPGPGMLCICGEVTEANLSDGSMVAPDSPAPAWRRPTLDEMIAIIEGRTPPGIRAWLDAAAPPA